MGCCESSNNTKGKEKIYSENEYNEKKENVEKKSNSNFLSNLFSSNKDEKKKEDGGTLNNIITFSKNNVGKLKNIAKISSFAKSLFG